MTESEAKPKAKRASRTSVPSKNAAKLTKSASTGTKAKGSGKPITSPKPGAIQAKPVKLLAGGNRKISRPDGDGSVLARMKSTKKATGKEAQPIKERKGEKVAVVLLSGGNPQIAKADGDAPVQTYINAMPGWKHDIGRWLDSVIVRNVPDVRKAVKWNTPFYGIEGEGWFLGFHCVTKYVKVAFFRGTSLRPLPPGESTQKEVRYLHIHEGDQLDEVQMATWLQQAAALPGWVP